MRPGDLNVVLIVADDLNTDLGAYGNPLARTPNIDAIAARGVRFDRAYLQYPLCNPSRVSFLSGRRPEATGVLDNDTDPRVRLGPDVSFLPEYFHEHGYYTARVGKIMGGPAEESAVGWDESLGSVADDYRPNSMVWDPPDRLPGQPYWKATDNPDADEPDGRNARHAVRIIEEHAGQPFFLAVGFLRPHLPFVAPRSYFDAHPPALSVGDAAVVEGSAGTSKAAFKVRLGAPSVTTVAAAYATGAGGTATSGDDYQARAGALTFDPGETMKVVNVFVVGDRAPEPAETFYLNLTSASGAAIADGQGRGLIADDDR